MPWGANQTGIAASEETVSSFTRTDVFCFSWRRPDGQNQLRSPDRQTTANLSPSPVCGRVPNFIRSTVIPCRPLPTQ